MKFSSLIVVASVGLCAAVFSRAADATTPVDYTDRNAPFAPSATVAPAKKSPQVNESVQDKRVEKNTVEKKPAAVGERRAAIDLTEAREKNIVEKNSHRPEKTEQPASRFDHREASMSTAADSKKPQMVVKYQDGLTSASATNMARFPAIERGTAAKLNRFVFRKNGSETAGALDGATVTPAGGGAAGSK